MSYLVYFREWNDTTRRGATLTDRLDDALDYWLELCAGIEPRSGWSAIIDDVSVAVGDSPDAPHIRALSWTREDNDGVALDVGTGALLTEEQWEAMPGENDSPADIAKAVRASRGITCTAL